MHFDSQESFVVQLKGKKRWWLAPNRDVDFPTENYIAVTPFRLHSRRRRISRSRRSCPVMRSRLVLKPGSIHVRSTRDVARDRDDRGVMASRFDDAAADLGRSRRWVVGPALPHEGPLASADGSTKAGCTNTCSG